MGIKCICDSCKADFEIAHQFAGREAHCPMCSEPLVVPSPAQAEQSPSLRETHPKDAPTRDEAVPAIAIDAAASKGGVVSGSRLTRPRGRKKRKTLEHTILICGGILALGLGSVLAYLALVDPPPPPPEEPATIEIDWDVLRERGSKLTINGENKHLPQSGPIKYSVPPGKHHVVAKCRSLEPQEWTVSLGSGDYRVLAPTATLLLNLPKDHRNEVRVVISGQQAELTGPAPVECQVRAGMQYVVVERRGYAPISFVQQFKPDQRVEYTPIWPPTLDDWEQDFEAAKRQAKRDGKDIFVLFNDSDSCPFSQALADEVLETREFWDRARNRYVLVHLDLPQGRNAKAKVEDPERNSRLRSHFGIRAVPTGILIDPSGQPFGVVRGYKKGSGVLSYMARLDECHSVREEIARLRREIEAASDSSDRLARLEELIEIAKEYGLGGFFDKEMDEAARLKEALEPPTQLVAGDNSPVESAPNEVPKEEVAKKKQYPEDYATAGELLEEKLGLEFVASQTGSVITGAHLLLPDERELILKDLPQAHTARKAVERGKENVESARKSAESKELALDKLKRERDGIEKQLQGPIAIFERKTLKRLADLRTKLIPDAEAAFDNARRALARAEATVTRDCLKFYRQASRIHEHYEKLSQTYAAYRADPNVQRAIADYRTRKGVPVELGVELGPTSNFKELRVNVVDLQLQAHEWFRELQKNQLTDKVPMWRNNKVWLTRVTVNGGTPVNMVIDTGASAVVLPWNVATAAGMTPGPDTPRRVVHTAGGLAVAWEVTAKEITVGKFTAKNVTCLVQPRGTLEVGLLGQTYLQRYRWSQDTATKRLILSSGDAPQD